MRGTKGVINSPLARPRPCESDAKKLTGFGSFNMTKKNGKAIWASKIVGHDRVDPNSLVANPYNHRKHPQKQRDALAAAIREVGFIRSVTVNKRTGNVIDGHERLVQAIESGQPEIDVEYVDLSEEDKRKACEVEGSRAKWPVRRKAGFTYFTSLKLSAVFRSMPK